MNNHACVLILALISLQNIHVAACNVLRIIFHFFLFPSTLTPILGRVTAMMANSGQYGPRLSILRIVVSMAGTVFPPRTTANLPSNLLLRSSLPRSQQVMVRVS